MAVHNHIFHGHAHGHTHGHAPEHCLKMARREDGTPWWADFPEPTSTAIQVEPQEVFQLLHDRELSVNKRQDTLLVDARRSDCTGGTVRGAMNLPAHSFYPTRKSLYELCKQAGIQRVIFYCGKSISNLVAQLPGELTMANPPFDRLFSWPRSPLCCLVAGLCQRGRW